MSLVALFKGRGPSGFGFGSTAQQVTEGLDLIGKVFLVTGCNSGLGLETMRVLSLRRGEVIAAARSETKAQQAIEASGAKGTPLECDLAEPTSILQAVARLKEIGRPLDAMICNAGVMAFPKLQTQHGIEKQFFINHIGHFLLVTRALPHLVPDGRIVITSSVAHKHTYPEGIQFDNLTGEKGYSSWNAYGQSKLANILFTRHLAKKLEGTGQTANCLHPGVIATNLTRHMNVVARVAMQIGTPLFLKSIPQGAATQVYLATHPDVAATNGAYFADCNVAIPSSHGQDDAMAQRLWEVSEQIVAQWT